MANAGCCRRSFCFAICFRSMAVMFSSIAHSTSTTMHHHHRTPPPRTISSISITASMAVDFLTELLVATCCSLPALAEFVPGFEILELFGLTEGPEQAIRSQAAALRSSGSRFLRQVYNEMNEDKSQQKKIRHKRTATEDVNFITDFDRLEIEKCNNFITFASKNKFPLLEPEPEYVRLYFNTKDVPNDLRLIHSTLRLFMEPALDSTEEDQPLENVTLSLYERKSFSTNDRHGIDNFRIFASVNVTASYRGWLELNMTRLLSKWLKYRKYRPVKFLNELLIEATAGKIKSFNAQQLGIVQTEFNHTSGERSPFIIGYFNGPQLVEKMHKLRVKREVGRRQRPHFSMPAGMNALHLQYVPRQPKTCERLNFTVNFKDTYMDSWVIAPKKFEAYFCGGECNFPLGAHMNATNHAIVQTLMQLKQPHLPKPCCAPTALESIHILRFLNEDNVNLVKFPDSVVKECGCH